MHIHPWHTHPSMQARTSAGDQQRRSAMWGKMPGRLPSERVILLLLLACGVQLS